MYWLILLSVLVLAAIVHTILFKLVILQSQTMARLTDQEIEIPTPAWSRCLASLIYVGIIFAFPVAIIDYLVQISTPILSLQLTAALVSTTILAGILWFVFRKEYELPARLAVMAATCFIAYSKMISFSTLIVLRQFA